MAFGDCTPDQRVNALRPDFSDRYRQYMQRASGGTAHGVNWLGMVLCQEPDRSARGVTAGQQYRVITIGRPALHGQMFDGK